MGCESETGMSYGGLSLSGLQLLPDDVEYECVMYTASVVEVTVKSCGEQITGACHLRTCWRRRLLGLD